METRFLQLQSRCSARCPSGVRRFSTGEANSMRMLRPVSRIMPSHPVAMASTGRCWGGHCLRFSGCDANLELELATDIMYVSWIVKSVAGRVPSDRAASGSSDPMSGMSPHSVGDSRLRCEISPLVSEEILGWSRAMIVRSAVSAEDFTSVGLAILADVCIRTSAMLSPSAFDCSACGC